MLVTAFSTSSSSATLPAALAVARERLGVSPSTAGFVLPLGTTMNMSGTALFEGCVVLFVAQVFGVHLDLAQQVTLVLLSVLSAVEGLAVATLPPPPPRPRHRAGRAGGDLEASLRQETRYTSSSA